MAVGLLGSRTKFSSRSDACSPKFYSTWPVESRCSEHTHKSGPNPANISEVVVGNKKIIMLVGSILLGALAGFALLGYVRGVEDDIRDEVTRVPVWVISGDIAQGTTAAEAQQSGRLSDSSIESGFRPVSAVNDLVQIEGQIAASDLVANQVLVTGHFADPSVVETTFADQISEGYVAISITVSRENAVNGFLAPGDFVDFIVLGDPPAPVGEEDAFENSIVASPYERPARTLYRGVRIESVNNEIIGNVSAGEDDVANNEEANAALKLTIAVPPSAVQRILSISPDDIVLGLLPPDWEPEAQENEITEAIVGDEDLPGEDDDLITPYGADGFEVEEDVENADDVDTVFEETSDEAPAENAEEVDEGTEEAVEEEG